jgi:hypothetical protein
MQCYIGLSVITQQQTTMIEVFATARPANALFCHQEFLEKLAEHRNDGIGRRAAFLMQRLAVDLNRLHYKATSGANRGWRRSRLGGTSGSHFYAWWAPRNAAPIESCPDFPTPSEPAIFLRDIRHHDDHSPLHAQSFDACYLPVTVRDLRRDEYGPSPWTQPQNKFATARASVRLLKGHPGSGKTTALWHAADATGAERVLYITYSRDLAALAKDYFERYCSSHRQFEVLTFPTLVHRIAGSTSDAVPERESIRQFMRDISPFVRHLGPWNGSLTALYDEMHAHLAGAALPRAVGRFAAATGPRVPDKSYRERRDRFIGSQAAASTVDIATRLERIGSSQLAERYFPEIALAWKAVERLSSQAGAPWTSFDCIAVDECQDLTPIESFLVVQLASLINRSRKTGIPVLLAGDEAQTVRPTDFEWGWLSDLLHAGIGTPSDFRLGSNLRSPRRIAGLVNSVWDLYGHIQKQDRPSGSGYASIDDDATDQILYCTAVPGPELDALFTALANREGLAMITLEDEIPAFVPQTARGAVLTVREAKGLDFHSVCVIDGGRQVERIVRERERLRVDSDIECLRKRLAIDQLRVALSRPTERLLWIDVSPTDRIVHHSLSFLNGGEASVGVSSSVPGAVLKVIEEEELDPEERLQRCQSDARQFLSVKPEMAWSRAQQAVMLLGESGTPAAILDLEARNAAHLTAAEICFALGMRGVRLPAELGRPDLFEEARDAAEAADKFGLGAAISTIGNAHRSPPATRLQSLAELAQRLVICRREITPWILVEIAGVSEQWVNELESGLFNGHNASVLLNILPPFYEILGVAGAGQRIQRLRQKSLQLLMQEKQFAEALKILESLDPKQPRLEALCHEGMHEFRLAAECYRSLRDMKEALRCYRLIPDLHAALEAVREIGNHPAAESLEWIARLEKVIAERPDKFNRVILPSEKKMLESLLEQSLGVTRKKPAVKKAAVKKAAPKAATKKTAPKKPSPAPRWTDIDQF